MELLWEGKYDKEGKRVAPLRASLPFQTVEAVNESIQDRQRTLDLFQSGRDAEWRNRLIWGDKKYVLPSLLTEFAGTVDLIYIDPPFATGADFSLPIKVDGAGFTKEPSVIEQKAYRDTWGVSAADRRRGVTPSDRYIKWMYETVVLLRELLSEKGSLYLHIGPNVNHLVRACLDEVFGVAHFRAEIIWKRTSAHGDAGQGARHFGRVHDCILLYTASDQFVWHPPFASHSDQYVSSHYSNIESETGRPALSAHRPDRARRSCEREPAIRSDGCHEVLALQQREHGTADRRRPSGATKTWRRASVQQQRVPILGHGYLLTRLSMVAWTVFRPATSERRPDRVAHLGG